MLVKYVASLVQVKSIWVEGSDDETTYMVSSFPNHQETTESQFRTTFCKRLINNIGTKSGKTQGLSALTSLYSNIDRSAGECSVFSLNDWHFQPYRFHVRRIFRCQSNIQIYMMLLISVCASHHRQPFALEMKWIVNCFLPCHSIYSVQCWMNVTCIHLVPR